MWKANSSLVIQSFRLTFIALLAIVVIAVERATAAPKAALRNETVRLRGPLHEAFAAPLAGAEEAGATVEGRPGPLLAELPTAVKPAASNAVWIPGYWGWDPAGDEFVWVPGIWRVPPPGMRWVPGYWSEHDDRSRWVRGFWYPVSEPRLRYLPPPPETQEAPPSPPDSPEQFNVPAHWAYAQGQYRWNRGFTARHKSGWVWMPSHFAWTPRGAIFLPGYWDHAPRSRGLVFAPASISDAGEKSSAAFTPKVALHMAALSEALFVGAGLGHYYFGDYFDGDFADELPPWYAAPSGSPEEPLFAYERWRQRAVPDWRQALARRYERRRDDEQLRPPLQFSERAVGDVSVTGDQPDLGVSIAARSRARGVGRPFTEILPDALRRVVQNSAGIRSLTVQRAKFEADGAPATREAPLAFYLPAAIETFERTDSGVRPRSATAGQYVPGVAGREVPGTVGERLPGMSGRTVPGVDIHVPGATAPGVLPGADTGGELPK
jgi:hypothetical protein